MDTPILLNLTPAASPLASAQPWHFAYRIILYLVNEETSHF
jgi:hypothetical protein